MQSTTRLAPCARSIIGYGLRRNIGFSSVAMAKGQAVTDGVQKLYIDKIREYAKLASAGKVELDAKTKRNFDAEATKLKKYYGGGDITKFPEFQFKEIDFNAKQD